MTIRGHNVLVSIFNQPPKLTQPPLLSGRENEYRPKCIDGCVAEGWKQACSFHRWINHMLYRCILEMIYKVLYESIGFTKVRHYMWTERPSLWRLVVIVLQGYQCQHCSCAFCVDCDLFVHETMHSCPGCASSRQTNSWFFAFARLPSRELSATAHHVAWQNRQCVVVVGFLNSVDSANHLWVIVVEKKSCMLQILPCHLYACDLLFRVHFFLLTYSTPWVKKKGATLTIAITLSILDQFAKFFHCCKQQ